MPATTKNTPPVSTQPAVAEIPVDLKRLHELCAFHAASAKDLALLHARLEREWLQLIGRHKDEIVELEHAQKNTIAAIEALARQHGEWFGEKRQLKTPMGVIKFTLARSLSIPDADKTINKLFARGHRTPDFDPMLYVTMDTRLDKQALKKLSPALLERLGVEIVEEDSFSFEPVIVDMKKFLAASAPDPERAAA